MARVLSEGSGKGVEAQPTNLTINDAGAIQLPDGVEASACEITRDGQDLVLTTPDGQTFVVENYFSMADAPVIISDSGALLSPALVMSFIKPAAGDVQVAATQTANDASPVGEVTEVTGAATVTHADGTKETITAGTQIFEGDIVETDAKGAVNIKFADDSTFAVSENARLAVDDFSFNAEDQSGTTGLSILRGVFMFTSGLIGRENPDAVTLETPVGSIGIRGTIIGGNIQEGGQTTISVIEGAIVVRNGTGEQILSQQFETVTLTAFSAPIVNVGTMNAGQMTQTYGSVRPVSPTLFTSIDDTSRDTGNTQQQTQQQGETQQQTAPETQPEAEQPAAPEAPVQPSVLNETPVFQTLTTGSNIDNALGAPPAPTQTAAPLPPAGPANTTSTTTQTAPQTLTPPQQDIGDRRAPSGVQFATGGSVAEESTTGTPVGRVAMTDSSLGFPVTYSIVNDPSNKFSINSATGEVFLRDHAGDVDATSLTHYDLVVRVTRNDTGQSSETNLSVGVTPVDEAPAFGSTGITVAEGAFTVLTASMVGATDQEGQAITYTVTGQTKGLIEVDNGGGFAPATSFTHAQLVAGEVKFLHNGDEPSAAFVKLVATDSTGHASPEKTVTVTVTPTNDDPTASNTTLGTPEDTVGTLDLFALVADVDSTLTAASISVGNPANGTAVYNSATGVVTYTPNTDYNGTDSFTYTVNDGVGGTTTKTVNVNVGSVNDAPYVTVNATDLHATEGSAVVIPSSKLHYSDIEGQTITYTLTGTLNGTVQYDTTGSGNWVALATSDTFTQSDINDSRIRFLHNDTETTSGSFDFTVTDGVATPQSGTFNLTVDPVNDAATLVSIDSVKNIDEGTYGDRELISVISITDSENPATSADYTFDIQGWTGSTFANNYGPSDKFEVDRVGGEWRLYLKAGETLDHETAASLQLRLVLTDGVHAPITTAPITINVTNVNEAATAFDINDGKDYAAGVDALVSGKTDGGFIAVLKAVDPDQDVGSHPHEGNYRIVSLSTGTAGGLDQNDFEIIDIARNGKIETILKVKDGRTANFASEESFSITVEMDPNEDGNWSDAIAMEFDVIGRNDTLVLEAVNGKNGFRIENDARPGSMFGYSVTVGDVDGDGKKDLVFGAPLAMNSQTEASGGVYGLMNSLTLKTDASDGKVTLQSLVSAANPGFFHELTTGVNDTHAYYGSHVAVLRNYSGMGTSAVAITRPDNGVIEILQNGNPGTKLLITNVPATGVNAYEKLIVASVGDINGDGFGDLLVGSPTANANAGVVGVFLGNASQSADTNFSAAAAILNTTSPQAGAQFGAQVTALGDLDGDGRADFAVSSPNYDTGGTTETGQGRISVYFGSNNMSTLSSSKLTIDGLVSDHQGHLGASISNAGDFNGDGLKDLVIRSHNQVHLIYGDPDLRGDTVNIAGLNSTSDFNGVTITHGNMQTGDKIGSVSSAGDFNGDGYADIAVDYARYLSGTDYEHTVFILYGSATPTNLDLNNLASGSFFKIRMLDKSGESLTLTAAGDFNGDGYDDLLIGDPYHSNNDNGQKDGAVTMVYGDNYDGRAIEIGASGTATPVNKTFVGTATANNLDNAGEGSVSFRAGAGDDSFILRNNTDFKHFNGGEGFDTLRLFNNDPSANTLDLRGVGKKTVSVESIQFGDDNLNDTLVLDVRDVLSMAASSSSGKLIISAGGSTLDSNHLQLWLDGNTAADLSNLTDTALNFSNTVGTTNVGGVDYDVYTHNVTGLQLLVDQRLAGSDTLVA